MSGLDLSARTHKDGSAWANTYKPGEFNITIPNQAILEHYKEMIQDAETSIKNKHVA